MNHTRNLNRIQGNLAIAQGDALAYPTDWNLGRVERLTQALSDYQRHMAGEITRHEMCQTAQELTMTMPEWGTRGT
jgi:hypothetical protein